VTVEGVYKNRYDVTLYSTKDSQSFYKVKPKLLERRKVIPRVTDKILGYVSKFMDVAVVNNSEYEDVMMVAELKRCMGSRGFCVEYCVG
jgi:type I restriction enzyme R subunit